MLSSLPKLADRNFVLGFLLPVLIAMAAVAALCRDVEPVSSIWAAILQAKSFTDLTLLAIALWCAAVLLLVCNHPLYQLLEGYWGPFNRPEWRTAMQTQFSGERDDLRAAYAQIQTLGVAAPADTKREYYAQLRDLYERFPFRRHLVLPTRFGNVIRAFETYPLKVYGVDSIAAWPRMASVVPKSLQAAIDNARAEVDFFVNLWLLALGVALLAGVRSGIWLYHAWPLPGFASVPWVYPASGAGAVVLAFLTYEGAIARGRAWGSLVKSAFDLYLPALATLLGYRLPATKADRVAFWSTVNSMFLYQTPIAPEAWPQATPEAPGAGKPVADAPGQEGGDETCGAGEDEEDGS